MHSRERNTFGGMQEELGWFAEPEPYRITAVQGEDSIYRRVDRE